MLRFKMIEPREAFTAYAKRLEKREALTPRRREERGHHRRARPRRLRSSWIARRSSSGGAIASGAPRRWPSTSWPSGTSLLECGCPAYRVESAVRTIAALEGYRAEAFALPTGLFVNVRGEGPSATPVHRMARITEWGLDLDRLVRVDDVFNAVARGERDLAAAEDDLEAHRASPRPWPRALRWLAIGAVGGAAAVFFRGSLVDAGVSAVLALALHGAIFAVKKNPAARFLQDFVHAFLAAVLAYGASRLVSGASRDAIVLATIVSRVPGMTLTTGPRPSSRRRTSCRAARGSWRRS
jgi:uncharacterized membrane protein YjjP (DUF1212 family)